MVFLDPDVPPEPLPGPKMPPPSAEGKARVVSLDWKVQVDNVVSRVKLEQVFENTGSQASEARFVFPLPPGASVASFAMIVDGKRVEAQIKEKAEAQQSFQQLLRRRREPALLEFLGKNLFEARLGVVPAGQTRVVELVYEETLKPRAGVFELRLPFQAGGQTLETAPEVRVEGKILTNFALHNVYSPSHELAIDRYGKRKVKFFYERADEPLSRDLSLFFASSEKDLGLHVLTHRAAGEDGYFMLMLSPPVGDAVQAVPRDVSLVVDVSGSMRGEKLKQAKRAMYYCIQQLRGDDRFQLVQFSSKARNLTKGFWPADKAHKVKARKLLKRMKARGGTNIHGALMRSFRERDTKRTHVLIFLTDGEPTEGVTDPDQILTRVQKKNQGVSRLFVVGVGFDLDVKLLDGLSGRNRGSSVYVEPKQAIDEEIERWYRKISYPVLTDLEIDFGEVETEFTYPEVLPDLHQGDQLLLVGRYRNPGTALVTLEGKGGSGEQRFLYDVDFPREELERDFLPRLWARRRVGYLLDRIRLLGEKDELVTEVKDLAKRYSIVTPYTSFLVRGPHRAVEEGLMELESEKKPRAPRPVPRRLAKGRLARPPGAASDFVSSPDVAPPPPPLAANGAGGGFSGDLGMDADVAFGDDLEDSFEEAPEIGVLRDSPARRPAKLAPVARRPAPQGFGKYRPGQFIPPNASGRSRAAAPVMDLRSKSGKSAVKAAQQLEKLKESSVVGEAASADVRYLAGKSFRLQGGVWTDGELSSAKGRPELAIRFGSEAYFLLLAEKPGLARFLGLGEDVVVVFQGVVVRVRSTQGAESLTQEALQAAFREGGGK